MSSPSPPAIEVPRVRTGAVSKARRQFGTLCNPRYGPLCCRAHAQQHKDTDSELAVLGVTSLEPSGIMSVPELLQIVCDEDGEVNLVVTVARLLLPKLTAGFTPDYRDKREKLLDAVRSFNKSPSDWLVSLDTSTPLDLSRRPLSWEDICAQYKAHWKTDKVPTDALAAVVGYRLQQSARAEMRKHIDEFVKAPSEEARLALFTKVGDLVDFASDMALVNAHLREAYNTLRNLVGSDGSNLAAALFTFMAEMSAFKVRVLPSANAIVPLSPLMFL
jgi:hypothetical protein